MPETTSLKNRCAYASIKAYKHDKGCNIVRLSGRICTTKTIICFQIYDSTQAFHTRLYVSAAARGVYIRLYKG